MQAIGRQPQRAPDGAPVHYERHRPTQTTLYGLVQQHVASSIAPIEASTGAQRIRDCGSAGFCFTAATIASPSWAVSKDFPPT